MVKNEICEMGNGNKIIGYYPKVNNSTITFIGENNILYCEQGVELVDSELRFEGNNSIIYLSSNRHKYKLYVRIFNNSVCFMGKDNYINQKLTIRLSEQKHCFIGDNGIISMNIVIRNADAHLIYSCSTGKRINESKSVFIGDHVWIGQDVRILKGAQIDSGSIVGAMSVVAGKRIMHNSSWAGNPCKLISDDVFWDITSVHDWTTEETAKSEMYSDYISAYKKGCSKDFWIYEYDSSECIEWCELEKKFSSELSAMEKCEYLIALKERKTKNRFVHN